MNCKFCKADCAHRGEERDRVCMGYIAMTNADHIRAMTDEELCNLLDEWWCMGANTDERLAYADERLAWLQQPCEEDDHV